MKKIYIDKIKLMDKSPRGDGLRPVQIVMNNNTYHFLKIEELLEILRLWIKGEEEKYPPPKFRGRWMLFDEIKKVFDENKNEKDKKFDEKDLLNVGEGLLDSFI